MEWGGRPPIGLLVGCGEASFATERVEVGVRLSLEARRTWGRREFGVFECRATIDGAEIAVASLTVARPDEGAMKQWKSQLS